MNCPLIFHFLIKLVFATNWEQNTVTHTLEVVIVKIMSLAISVIVAKRIITALTLDLAANLAIVPLHRTVRNAMIIQVIVDVSQVSPDGNAIAVHRDIGITHQKDVFVSVLCCINRCVSFKFHYTCTACSCNTDYSRGLGCNAQTGQCECLPGVIGEKCDACPARWVLIPDSGCYECDICHHALLDVTDALKTNLDPVIIDFETVASGFFTAQKLTYYNDMVLEIEPNVKALDPNGVNLTPLRQQIESLEMDVKNMDRRVLYSEQRAKDLAKGGFKSFNESRGVLDSSRFANNNVQNTIQEVEKLADSLDASQSNVKKFGVFCFMSYTLESFFFAGTKVENALTEAETILRQLNDFAIDAAPSTKQLNDTNAYFIQIQQFSGPVKQQNAKLETLRTHIGALSDKMEDLFEWSIDANKFSYEAQLLHNKNKNASVNAMFDTVANHSKATNDNIDETHKNGFKGNVTLGEIYRHVGTLENVNNELKEINKQVDKVLPQQEEEYTSLDDILERATDNKNKLVEAVSKLFRMIE